jgi:stalled ribosome rescue protein Dom34
LDHERAKVFYLDPETMNESTFKMPKHELSSRIKGRDTHHRGESHDLKEYFEAVVKAIASVPEVLLLGPGTAKLELVKHVHKNEPRVEKQIVGVETADHPTDAQIVAHARRYFLAKDRMLGSHVG